SPNIDLAPRVETLGNPSERGEERLGISTGGHEESEEGLDLRDVAPSLPGADDIAPVPERLAELPLSPRPANPSDDLAGEFFVVHVGTSIADPHIRGRTGGIFVSFPMALSPPTAQSTQYASKLRRLDSSTG